MTYLCTTWLGRLRNLYKDVVVFPSPHGLQTKEDSMRKWSKKHRNHIRLRRTAKESGGGGCQETQGSCSLHSFLSCFLLLHLSDSLKSEWPVRRSTSQPPTCTSARSPGLRAGPSVWHVQLCELRGQEGIPESCPPEQSFLTLTLCHRSWLHAVSLKSS